MNMIKYLIFILLFLKIQFYYYVSIDVNFIDDCCISKIILMKKDFNETYFVKDGDFSSESCRFGKFDYFQNPIIKNILYNLNESIYLEVYNQGILDGYIGITVYINEFIIESSSLLQFLKCDNCFGNNSNYIFLNDIFFLFNNLSNFYEDPTYKKSYYFYFRINNFSNLIANYSRINYDFYSLTNETIFNKSIYYKNDELELINFNTKENFYIKENNTLNISFTDYYFNIIFKNNFNGSLIGLDSNNSEIKLINGSTFYINETKGLKYILEPKEKYNYYSHLFFTLRAYNKYLNKNVTKEQEFHFFITLFGDYLNA